MPDVIKSTEVRPGEMKAVSLQGTQIAVVNVDGGFYAIVDTCPHDGCSLAEGMLEGHTVTCSKDGSSFDLFSGQVLTGPATSRVRTFRVQQRGDDLII